MNKTIAIARRGRRAVALLISVAAIIGLMLSASAARDAALPAWAEPYPLLDTVVQTEGSHLITSAALEDRFLFFRYGPYANGVDSMELWSTDGTTTGTVRHERRVAWNPADMVTLGESALFAAEAPDTGRELWITEGLGGARVLVDIEPGPGSSNPGLLTRVGDYVYFRATDAHQGDALWRTDGTADGTVRIKTFVDEGYFAGNVIEELAGGDDHFYLWAKDEAGAPAFWGSDGTSEGTVALHSYDPNASFPLPPRLMTLGNLGFAFSGQELWRSDGTPEGTFQITNAPLPTWTFYMAAGDSILYLIAHDWSEDKGELWRSDGTVVGTTKVADIGGGRLENEFVTVGDRLFFIHADDPNADPYGVELWTSDGTTGGTKMVKDIYPGPDGSHPYSLVAVDDEVYFSVKGEAELWRSDGTAAGTQHVALNTGEPIMPFVWPKAAFHNRLIVMVADNTHGREPWISDGTPQGSYMLADANPGNSDPSFPTSLTFYNNRLYFVAQGGLWMSEGKEKAAVQLVQAQGGDWYVTQFGPGLAGSNGFIYFTVEDYTTHSVELWRSDGTVAGSIRLQRVGETYISDPVREMTDLNGTLYFLASEGPTYNTIWRSDGTPTGTFPLDLFPSGINPADVRDLTAAGPFLYFAAAAGDYSSELWRTDGTQAGTGLADINPGPPGSNPTHLTDLNGDLFFAADDGRRGVELWLSDSSANGIYLVKDINPTPGGSSSPGSLVVMRNVLYFLADDGIHGVELWRSDGTAAGTYLVKDVIPGSGHPPALELVAGQDRVFFRAGTETSGYDVWISDGTAAGTTRVQTPVGDGGDYPTKLTAVDNVVFFVLYPANDHLYRSDGTATGTFALNDAFPFFDDHDPWFLTSAPGRLFFSVDSAEYGREPFILLTSLVTFSPDFLYLPEGGVAKQFTVALNRPPSADVTIALSGSESLEIIPAALTFTSANWQTPQTVRVRAPGDTLDQGTRPAEILLAISSPHTLFNDNTHALPLLIRQWRFAYSPMITR